MTCPGPQSGGGAEVLTLKAPFQAFDLSHHTPLAVLQYSFLCPCACAVPIPRVPGICGLQLDCSLSSRTQLLAELRHHHPSPHPLSQHLLCHTEALSLSLDGNLPKKFQDHSLYLGVPILLDERLTYNRLATKINWFQDISHRRRSRVCPWDPGSGLPVYSPRPAVCSAPLLLPAVPGLGDFRNSLHVPNVLLDLCTIAGV